MKVEVNLSELVNLSNKELLKMAKETNSNVFYIKGRIHALLKQFPPSSTISKEK